MGLSSLSGVTCVLGVATLSVATLSAVALACSVGVSGLGDVGATVCVLRAMDSESLCDDVVSSTGYWSADGDIDGCMATSGYIYFYEEACPEDGQWVNRSDGSKHYGGSWLDISCDPSTAYDPTPSSIPTLARSPVTLAKVGDSPGRPSSTSGSASARVAVSPPVVAVCTPARTGDDATCDWIECQAKQSCGERYVEARYACEPLYHGPPPDACADRIEELEDACWEPEAVRCGEETGGLPDDE